MRTVLTRRYRFSAVHVLARRDWGAARNRDVYGKCANPAGHGHDYGVEVAVHGPVDGNSGRILDVAVLDRVVGERVLEPLDGRHLNRDVGAFEVEVPTAENIARYVWKALEGAIPGAELDRVRIIETRNNSVAYREYEQGRETA